MGRGNKGHDGVYMRGIDGSLWWRMTYARWPMELLRGLIGV